MLYYPGKGPFVFGTSIKKLLNGAIYFCIAIIIHSLYLTLSARN